MTRHKNQVTVPPVIIILAIVFILQFVGALYITHNYEAPHILTSAVSYIERTPDDGLTSMDKEGTHQENLEMVSFLKP